MLREPRSPIRGLLSLLAGEVERRAHSRIPAFPGRGEKSVLVDVQPGGLCPSLFVPGEFGRSGHGGADTLREKGAEVARGIERERAGAFFL